MMFALARDEETDTQPVDYDDAHKSFVCGDVNDYC